MRSIASLHSRFRLHARLGLPALLGLLALPLAAQTSSLAAPGFQLTPPARPVGLFDAYATLGNGERIVYDGVTVRRVAADGTTIAQLASFPAFTFPSFVVIDPNENVALIGESDFGMLHVVDLAQGGALPLADVDYNYDAVFEDPTSVLVSAAPCIANCGSSIHRVDLGSGAVTLIATTTGASGPVALSADGDLYYGLQPPSVFAPPGSWSIVRWTAAQIQSGIVLGVADAVPFTTGLDGASALAFDPVYGHLFVAVAPFTGTSRVQAIEPNGQVFGNVVETAGFLSKLEPFPTGGTGALQAYQPPGMMLLYRTTDYVNSVSTIERVDPKRPIATTSGPGLTGPGPVTFTLQGGVPNGSFLALIGPQGAYTVLEDVSDTGTFLFHTGMHSIRRTGLFVPTDANGDGSFTFINPGTLQGTRVLQAVLRDVHNRYVGTSTVAFL